LVLQSGFNDQLYHLKELRRYLQTQDHSFAARFSSFSEQTLQTIVFIQALLMIVSGALVIADVRLGGLVMSLAMLTVAATRDNPLLSTSEATYRMNMQNMLKDLAVAGIGMTIFSRRLQVRHRKERRAHLD